MHRDLSKLILIQVSTTGLKLINLASINVTITGLRKADLPVILFDEYELSYVAALLFLNISFLSHEQISIRKVYSDLHCKAPSVIHQGQIKTTISVVSVDF